MENTTKDRPGDQGGDIDIELPDTTGKASNEDFGEEDKVSVSEVEKLKAEIAELKDKFVRQAAEFDNYRKRNARERLELIQTAGKDIMSSLVEVLDDCDRAEKQLQTSEEVDKVKEGVLHVFNKLRSTLYAKGLRPMESIGAEFNPDIHEAIAEIPAPSDHLKGKILDEVQKGYFLNDKIIRFAKVVVGK